MVNRFKCKVFTKSYSGYSIFFGVLCQMTVDPLSLKLQRAKQFDGLTGLKMLASMADRTLKRVYSTRFPGDPRPLSHQNRQTLHNGKGVQGFEGWNAFGAQSGPGLQNCF
jgi:hypothetical protein